MNSEEYWAWTRWLVGMLMIIVMLWVVDNDITTRLGRIEHAAPIVTTAATASPTPISPHACLPPLCHIIPTTSPTPRITPTPAHRSRTFLPTKRSGDPSPAQWARLRYCESSGNYSDTKGSFWGAYQAEQGTWDGVMSRHNSFWVGRHASDAPPSVQDSFAIWLYHERGAQPWPVCGRFL